MGEVIIICLTALLIFSEGVYVAREILIRRLAPPPPVDSERIERIEQTLREHKAAINSIVLKNHRS